MKYSLVMPYYKRRSQLRNTLASLVYHYADRSDYELVVVEDSKNDDGVGELLDSFADRIRIVRLLIANDDSHNPARLYNAGVGVARGQYIVVTNPECLHATDVLDIFDGALLRTPDSYVVAACMSGKKCGRFINPESFSYKRHMWYQHTIHRNARYHFCSVLLRSRFLSIGGFDERLSGGIGYDDDAFLARIVQSGIPVVNRDDALVVHQEHAKMTDRRTFGKLTAQNRRLYERLYR